MKNIPKILIVILFLSSCNQISKNVENSFVEINSKLIDSIGVVNSKNQHLFNTINSKRIQKWQGENSAAVFYSINNLNEFIDSVQNIIISNSKFTSDKSSLTKFLIEEKFAKRIQEKSIETRESIIGSTIRISFSKEVLDFISPGDKGAYANESWDKNMFKELPAFASIPMLNKWKLENEKCQQVLLNQILKEIEYPSKQQTLNTTIQSKKIAEEKLDTSNNYNELANIQNRKIQTISAYNSDNEKIENIKRPEYSIFKNLEIDTSKLFGIWIQDPNGPHADFWITAKSFYVVDYDGDGNMPYILDKNEISIFYNDFIQKGVIISSEIDTLKIRWENITSESKYVKFDN